jgi:hypothetical protein
MPDNFSQWSLAAACIAIIIAAALALVVRRNGATRGGLFLAHTILLLATVALLAWTLVRQPTLGRANGEVAPVWHRLASGTTESIGGLASLPAGPGETAFIAVHDNKAPGEKRLSEIKRTADGRIVTRTLTWKAEPLPIDLEAICRLPGDGSTFLALTSRGALYRFSWREGEPDLTIETTPIGVPNSAEERQFEGIDVQQVGGQTFACWAERGSMDAPGVLFCSTFDVTTLTFGEVQALEIRVPWPESHTRHISDLRLLTDGTILAASASDPGNDGPFSGAVYIAGTLRPAPARPELIPAEPITRLFTSRTHKIEAIELVPGPRGGLAIGSDDENAGGAILFTW